MRCLVDEQLPVALARWLTAQSVEGIHVKDIGLQNATDQRIWAEAITLDAVIVTKDDDFVLLHAQDAQGPQIILVRVGNVSNARLIEIFEQLWPSVVVALEAGDRLIEFSDGQRLK